MADRYFVATTDIGGGVYEWSNTDNWSASSGGATGASKPTSADNVYFDANSDPGGAWTVKIDETAYCLAMDWTGAANTPTLDCGAFFINFVGNVTFISAMTATSTTGGINCIATVLASLTTNGLSLGCRFTKDTTSAGTVSLADSLTITNSNSMKLEKGTINFAGQTVSILGKIEISGADAKTLNMSFSTVTCVGFEYTGSNLTLTEASSTIIITGTGNLYGNGETFNNVELTGSVHTITGSNTFTNLTFNRSDAGAQTITITDGTTQTVSGALVMAGESVTNQLTVTKSGAGADPEIDYTGASISKAYTVITDVTMTGTVITDRHWVGDGGNWSDTGHWSDNIGGGSGASKPTNSNNVYFDAGSFTLAGQVVMVDENAYCLAMDWTGCTNTPTITGGFQLWIAGDITLGTASYTVAKVYSNGTCSFTSNGNAFNVGYLNLSTNGKVTLMDDYSSTGYIALGTATSDFNTGNNNVDISYLWIQSITANPIQLGTSTINILGTTSGRGLFYSAGATVTIAANTANINIAGTGGLQGYDVNWNGASFNLTGTSHSVTGSFTCANLTRTGTATKTDSITFEAGSTVTVTGTLTLDGNSAVNRLLVQSDTLGTAATLNAAIVSVSNADFMDITGAGAGDWDISACAGNSGDCGGNTDITFTTAAAQTWDGSTASWDEVAHWTSRVPLPQDDVSAGGAGITITVDMPRVGKSITFTGTPTISLSNGIENYGSFTLPAGCTYTHNNQANYFRGRGNYELTTSGISIRSLFAYNPAGMITLQDDLECASGIYIRYGGSLDFNDNDVTVPFLEAYYTPDTLDLGDGTITITMASAITKLNCVDTLTLIPGNSTIVLTSSGTNAQTFAGGGLTYNNVTIEGAGNYALTITGSNTFNELEVDASEAAKTVKFADGTTQTVTTMTRDGGTNVITLQGTSTGGWAIVKSGGGWLLLDYLDISYSTATPANTWFAGTHSTDSGNNSGWVFKGMGSLNVTYRNRYL